MSLHTLSQTARMYFSRIRASTLLVLVAILLAFSSVGTTFYTIGQLNAQEAETRIIREDLSDEQAQRLADAEKRVQELALRDSRIAAQTVSNRKLILANRELILVLRSLANKRPDLFVGVDLPPSLQGAKSVTAPQTTKPKPKPKPKPDNPGPTPRSPEPSPPTSATNANPPFLPAPAPVSPNPLDPPTIGGVVGCIAPITCLLLDEA